MADLLKSGAAWLAKQRKAYASSSITYRRGGRVLSLLATRGRSFFDQSNEQGVVLKVQSEDWIVEAADLVIDGSRIQPSEGDRIIADGQEFDVCPYPPEPPFRNLDPYGVQLRIHSKLRGTAKP